MRAPLASVLFVAAVASAAPVELHVADVLGERVDVAPHAHNPTVLIFMSRTAKDASSLFARTVDERLLDQPVELVGIVDVRRYGGIFRGLATSRMRRSEEEARVARRQRRLDHGVDASPAAVDRWHLVGDFDGALFRRFGVETEPAQPVAFVVDGAGELHGPFRDVDTVVAAATAALPPR